MQQRKQNELLGVILHTNFPKQSTLIVEQKVSDINPLYTSADVTRRHVTQSDIHHSSVLTTPAYRQHQHRVSPSYTVIHLLCSYFINPHTSTLFQI